MLSRQDIEALKEYVSAPGNFGQNQAESTVRLHATHSNLKAEFIELRLDLHVRAPSIGYERCNIPPLLNTCTTTRHLSLTSAEITADDH